MRNRALHDALRAFALEAAALLSDDQRAGAELEFDVEEESGGRGPALYRYRPLTEAYIAQRWHRLRGLPSCPAACDALGAGAASWLRMNGLRGAQAEPALQAMLERLYEDATSFGFPEERFERVYRDVERTLYRDTVLATIVSPLHGLQLEDERVELGDGLSLSRGGALDAPIERDQAAVVLERELSPDDAVPEDEARERFRSLVTGLRLFKPGAVGPAGMGWRRSGEGRWTPLELDGAAPGRGDPWLLESGEEAELRHFLETLDDAAPRGAVAWALARFEMGCGRALDTEALSDYLLALRALLDATTDAGAAGLALRLAALCAEDGERRGLRRRVELAQSLERYVMGGGRGEELEDWIGSQSPRALVEELERHTRALLRDVVCGYLDADLKAVADEILLERPEREPQRRQPAVADAFEIEARDLRAAPAPPPRETLLDGVTPSADWGPTDEDPESYSAPV